MKKITLFWLLVLGTSLISAGSASAQGLFQVWDAKDGKTLEAEATSHNWETAALQNEGKQIRVPLTRFTEEHQKLILRRLPVDLSWEMSREVRKELVPDFKMKPGGAYDIWRLALFQTKGDERRQTDLVAKYKGWKEACFRAKALGKAAPLPPIVLEKKRI